MTLEGGEYGLQTPWADRGVGINVGAEYRKESLNFNTDIEFQTGDLAGQGGPTLAEPTVRSTSASCSPKSSADRRATPSSRSSRHRRLPLLGLQDRRRQQLHHRYVQVSAELAPVRDIRFRGQLQPGGPRAEHRRIVLPAGPWPVGRIGPVRGQRRRRMSRRRSALNTGLPAAQYGTGRCEPGEPVQPLFGGNVNLTPEKADTYTLGVVVQPRWVPGLAFTVDYFNIKVKNLIAALPFNGVLASCAVDRGSDVLQSHPSRRRRIAVQHGQWLYRPANQNVGGLTTKGFDFNASYNHKFAGAGTLNVSFVGTWTRHLIFDTGISAGSEAVDGVYDCAGFYGATCRLGGSSRRPIRSGGTSSVSASICRTASGFRVSGATSEVSPTTPLAVTPT